MSEVIASFKSLRSGSQVFALLMLFLCVILHTMWSGKSLHLPCILPFGMIIVLVCYQYAVCKKNMWAVCIVVSVKVDSVSSVNCVQSAFLQLVVEGMSVVVNVMLSLMSVMSPPLSCATYRYARW